MDTVTLKLKIVSTKIIAQRYHILANVDNVMPIDDSAISVETLPPVAVMSSFICNYLLLVLDHVSIEMT